MMELSPDLEPSLDEASYIAYVKRALPILKAQASLHEFVKQAWSILEPETDFVDGWHIQAICEHLEAVSAGTIRNLIINVPPRTCKSTIVSVMWPAWWWIREPFKRFLCASHSNDISIRDSINCRTIIESDWYQNNWGHIVNITQGQDTQKKFVNSRKGSRHSTSVGSKITGANGDVLIGDDLNDTKDVMSDTIRNKTNQWFGSAFSSRVSNRKTSCKVIMAQRSHEADITGYIIARDKEGRWVKLILPMEFEEKRKCKTAVLPSSKGKTWADPRKKEGELLWPEQDGPKEVAERKADLGSAYNIAGQLQQRPAPADGGILQKSWFKWWTKEKPPKIIHAIQSWDSALEDKNKARNNDPCWSACTTWGLFLDDNKNYNIILLSSFRTHCEFPDLRKLAKRLAFDYRDDGTVDIVPNENYTPNYVLVERKASGHSLIQELNRAGIITNGFNPTRYGDKVTRAKFVSHIIEGGRVWVPASPPGFISLRPYAESFVELCGIFPNSDAKDVVDSMTQVLIRLIEEGYLAHPTDKRRQDLDSDNGDRKFYGIDEDD
jgi:predicted phage terminase large subunit-like protein